MSLHDIFMQRAALEHQNMLNSDTSGIVLVSLAQGVAQGIQKQQEELQKQKQIEAQNKKAMEMYQTIGRGTKIKTSIDENGNVTNSFTSGENEDLSAIKLKVAEAGGDVKGINSVEDGLVALANKKSEVSSREKRLATQQETMNTFRMRNEFIKRPEVEDYITVKTNVNAMNSLLDKAKTGTVENKVALDQGLITMYNKLTDPQSVVRESEYARTPSNLPVVNAISGAIEKIQKGGAGLTDKDREALVIGARIIANERGKTYNESLDAYRNLSLDSGLDPAKVTRDYQNHQDYDVGQQSNHDVNTPVVGGVFNGEKILKVERMD